MSGCNNICQRTLDQTYADYTTSLSKIEGKRPRAFFREKLLAVNVLLRLFLKHRVWFTYDLHGLHSIDICTIERDCNSALGQTLLNFRHIDGAIILGTRLGSNGFYSERYVGQIGIGWNVEE